MTISPRPYASFLLWLLSCPSVLGTDLCIPGWVQTHWAELSFVCRDSFAAFYVIFFFWGGVPAHKMLAFELNVLRKQEAMHVEANFCSAAALNKNAEQSCWRREWELSKMSSKQDFPPHWSSICCMLKRVLEQQKALDDCVGKKRQLLCYLQLNETWLLGWLPFSSY